MDLETYARVVEENYQRLADILLSSNSDTSKIQRLLVIDLLPAPPMKRGYAIWSEGLLAEAFVGFPTSAFPALLERLRTATDNQDTSRLYKALTMWGDRFAAALSDWLYSDTVRLQDCAIYGLTLYAKGLNALCDAETPSVESRLHQTHYPELARFTRDWELGVAPALVIDLLPAPPMKRGYAIWSEGLLAQAFVGLPTSAFPALLERLRTATDNQDTSRLYKALTMWGDRFAAALSDWLYSDTVRLQDCAIYGLTLYAKGLNALCDAETPSVESRLHQTHYPELARFTRDWELGVAPAVLLSGHPRQALSQQLGKMLTDTADDTQRIAILRCIGRLRAPHQPAPGLADAISALASDTAARTLEREAVIALCYLDRAHASEYIRQHWLRGEPQRNMAAEILGLVRTDTAFEMLQALMADPSAETRRKAISSIESFESGDALRVLNTCQDADAKTQRQLLRSRNQLKRRLQRKSGSIRRSPSAIYSISPLVLLSQAPGKPVFTERELSAAIVPGLIADISSSRRYAVELGLLQRQGDVYRLSGMGTAAHWVEGYLQAGLDRYAGQPPDR